MRRGLTGRYVGHRLDHVVVTGRRTVRRHPPARLEQLEGHFLRGVGRHGKYLLFDWDDDEILVAHLRMSGQMLAAEPGAGTLPHTHAVLSFAGAGELRFVDPRTFGELFLGTPLGDGGSAQRVPAAPGMVAEIEHLGPDALDVAAPDLAAGLAGRRAPLKSLLVDQRVLAGIGNIYADEICFDARLRPDRPGGRLKRAQVARLTASVHRVLGAAIAGRGSSLADRQYLDLEGEAGLYQTEHRVYGRAGPAVHGLRPARRTGTVRRPQRFCLPQLPALARSLGPCAATSRRSGAWSQGRPPRRSRRPARQYVRKVSGIRVPSAGSEETFERAVLAVSEATTELLAGLPPRRQPPPSSPPLRRLRAS